MRTQDVIVVGAGIIGIACAYSLAKSGYTVTVIDRGKVGRACSYGNCGYICPSHVLPLTEPGAVWTGMRSLLNPRAAFRVKLQARSGLYRWLWEFAKRCSHRQMIAAGHDLHSLLEYSASEYQALFAEEAFDCEWNDGGLMYVFQSPKGMADHAVHDDLLRSEFGLASRQIEGSDLAATDPALRDGLAGAFLYEADGHLRPDKLVDAWASRASQYGARLVENCTLLDVERNATGVSALSTSQGRMTADHYVVATGAWSGKLGAMLGCSLPVEPGKGYSVTMTPPATPPRYPMLLPEHRVGVTPFRDAYRLGSMMEFAGYDTSIPAFRVRQLQASAQPYLREPVGDAVRETWYGWRPMTWDSLPIIGRVPGLSNAVLATGHNMLGLTMAAGTGKLVHDIITEAPPAIPITPYAAERLQS